MNETSHERRPHVGVVHNNDGIRWLLLMRDGGEAWIAHTKAANLPPVIAAALKLLAEKPTADFSFSTRTAAQIESEPFVENAGDLSDAAKGASITIFAPEGRPGDDTMWGDLWRSPWGGVSASGKEGRFRGHTIIDRLAGIFEPKDERPKHAVREVLVRRDWRIRDLAPTAFAVEPASKSRAPEHDQIQENSRVGRFIERAT